MKKLILFIMLLNFAQIAFSQSQNYDLNKLKSQVGKAVGVNPSDINSIKVLEFKNQRFVYAKYIKDNKNVTFVQEYKFTNAADGIGIGGSITCTGVGCSECDIEGLPDISSVYCSCMRATTETGHCDMTKTIGF